jgi:RNA polymerase sigma-70 factor, ECF subfamily
MAVSPTLDAPPALARGKLDAKRAKPAPGVAKPAPAVAVEGAGALYERYYDRVYGYCLYQLGSREEAEDAAQTTFLWAFRGLRRGVVPRAEASWLFTIAQNACRARHRARGRKREREVLSDPHVLQDLTAAPTREHEELVGLEDALARMPELQRRAILLREWRGMSYREIAAELELSGAAVETLIFRARRSLAELLAGRPAPKRARRFAVDFGSAAAALKAFGTGVGAKVAAGAAAALLAVAIAGSVPRAPQRPIVPAPVAPSGTAEPGSRPTRSAGTPRRAPRPAERQQTAKPKTAPAAPPATTSPSAGGDASVGETVGDATDSLPLVSDVAETLPLGVVTDALDSTVDTANDALPAPVADALP